MASQTLVDGDAFIYMKVGVHAKETLEDILVRKHREIEQAGVAFWGYGGSTCHPLTAVQPFAKEVTDRGTTIRLLMQEIDSHHFADQVRAASYSENGVEWKTVPKPINVLGSRYALVLGDLEEIDLNVELAKTRVGVGRLAGAPGSEYVRGRVDKACLIYAPTGAVAGLAEPISLRLSARLVPPYAVIMK
jgi:hypothetical protein